MEYGDSQCPYDYLRLQGHKFCGEALPSISRVTVDIFFKTDSSVTRRGFKFCAGSSGTGGGNNPWSSGNGDGSNPWSSGNGGNSNPWSSGNGGGSNPWSSRGGQAIEPTPEPTSEPTPEPTFEPSPHENFDGGHTAETVRETCGSYTIEAIAEERDNRIELFVDTYCISPLRNYNSRHWWKGSKPASILYIDGWYIVPRGNTTPFANPSQEFAQHAETPPVGEHQWKIWPRHGWRLANGDFNWSVATNVMFRGTCGGPCEAPTTAPTSIPTAQPTAIPTAIPTFDPTTAAIEGQVFSFKSGNCGALEISNNCVSTRGPRYPNRVDCTIGVTGRPEIEFERFELENHRMCSWDYLSFNERRLCGSMSFRHSKVETDIRFYTDVSVTRAGFKFCAVKRDDNPRGETVEVVVGNSQRNTKTVTTNQSVKCPSILNKSNWLGSDTYPDIFSVSTSGSSVSVTRLDHNGGWDMNLRIECEALPGSERRLDTEPIKEKVLLLNPFKEQAHNATLDDTSSLKPLAFNL